MFENYLVFEKGLILLSLASTMMVSAEAGVSASQLAT